MRAVKNRILGEGLLSTRDVWRRDRWRPGTRGRHSRACLRRLYFLPVGEGQHGIFVGGGASVRVPRIIGSGRMMEMMLTGRKMDAGEGQTLGLSHYVTESGKALEKGMELAIKIAGNAEISNYAIINAIPRINDMSISDGLFTESLAASLSRSNSEADERMANFKR